MNSSQYPGYIHTRHFLKSGQKCFCFSHHAYLSSVIINSLYNYFLAPDVSCFTGHNTDKPLYWLCYVTGIVVSLLAAKGHFSLRQCPDQHQGPLTQGKGWYFPWGKQLGHAADQSVQSSAEFMNEWSHTSTPSYAFMVCRGNTLFLVVKQSAKGFQDHPQIFSHSSSVFTGPVPDLLVWFVAYPSFHQH